MGNLINRSHAVYGLNEDARGDNLIDLNKFGFNGNGQEDISFERDNVHAREGNFIDKTTFFVQRDNLEAQKDEIIGDSPELRSLQLAARSDGLEDKTIIELNNHSIGTNEVAESCNMDSLPFQLLQKGACKDGATDQLVVEAKPHPIDDQLNNIFGRYYLIDSSPCCSQPALYEDGDYLQLLGIMQERIDRVS